MPDVAVGLGHTHLVVVGGIPYGAGLVRHGLIDLELLGSVEGCSQSDYLREYGHVIVADAVAGLVPPVVGRDAQTVDRNGAVHHQTDFLLRGQQRQQIVRTFLH